jgi:hypothetical protein
MSPARQPLHILRKDAIHLWPETLLSIALLIAFAWANAQSWLPSDGTLNVAAIAQPIIKFLIVVAWLVLVSRLVHDEELVGDRQFWTTRPYTWYSLLAAKALYLLVFIGLPFLVMQAWLLHHAGLYPTHLVPALLKNFLYISLIFLLPLAAIAAVTATFVRYISSVLVGLIYFFIVLAIVGHNWGENLQAPYLGYLLSGTLVVMILAALLLQYWRRKTLLARLILLAVPVAVMLIAAAAPANLLTAHRYPDNPAGKLTFAPQIVPPPASGRLAMLRNNVELEIPVVVQLNNLPETGYVEEQAFQVSVSGPAGFHFTSNWMPLQKSFNGLATLAYLPLLLPAAVFQKIHEQPVSLSVVMGVQTFLPGKPYTIAATESFFPVPGNAACRLSADTGALDCRYPFAKTGLTQFSATVHDGDCQTPGQRSATAFGVLEPSPTTSFGFAPVELGSAELNLGQSKVPLCPGTRTTFTQPQEGGYGRLHLDVPAITLDAYARRISPQSAGAPPTR